MVGNFSTSLSITDRAIRWKIWKHVEELNNTMNQLDLIGICRRLYPTTEEYVFIPSVHGTFTYIEHILCHKRSPNKFKRI